VNEADKPRPTLIYRITHIANLPWVLKNGVCAADGAAVDPHFRAIGHPDVIARRAEKMLPMTPDIALSALVPWYFCTRSVMLYNIATGYGCPKQNQDDVVYLVSSIEQLNAIRARYWISDRNAATARAVFFTADEPWRAALNWHVIKGNDFKQDPEHPEWAQQRQAECLVFRQVPLSGILGIVCRTAAVQSQIQQILASQNVSLKTAVGPHYYF